MKKSPIKSALIDKLHKGFVCTCIAVTIYGFSAIGLFYYRYLTEVKPKKLLENQSLLAEGSSEVLKDNVETLKL
ncbi:uncharacterized protein LOC108915878 [Anoplophora glabripennis]|uniref:uncharacterized protein LOC108915878 n=1 Tax=Anoplophora glabripennis TaxID=217634 RepID=UPI0008745FD8|nr:uncharacterized protein LOC108915878 [Anoplophora glabripennis]